jgi:hypothetical protein
VSNALLKVVVLIVGKAGKRNVINNRKVHIVDLSVIESNQVTICKFGGQSYRVVCDVFRRKNKRDVFDVLDIYGTCGTGLLYFFQVL